MNHYDELVSYETLEFSYESWFFRDIRVLARRASCWPEGMVPRWVFKIACIWAPRTALWYAVKRGLAEPDTIVPLMLLLDLHPGNKGSVIEQYAFKGL